MIASKAFNESLWQVDLTLFDRSYLRRVWVRSGLIWIFPIKNFTVFEGFRVFQKVVVKDSDTLPDQVSEGD